MPTAFDRQSAARIASVVRQAEARGRSELPGAASPRGQHIRRQRFAKITAAASTLGMYVATEQSRIHASDAWADHHAGLTWGVTSGDAGDLPEVNLTPGLPINWVVPVFSVATKDKRRQWMFEAQMIGFWAKITGSATITTNRWKYAWTEVQRTATGFQNLAGGRSGTTTTGFAINANEANNTGTTIEGNSIDRSGADYPAGFSMQAIRGDPVVWMVPTYDSVGAIVYTFELANAEDGTCEAP